MRPPNNRPNFSTLSTFMPAASATSAGGLGPSLHFSSPSTSHHGITNPVFVDVQDQATPPSPPPPPPPPPPLPPPPPPLSAADLIVEDHHHHLVDRQKNLPTKRPETVDRTDSASSLSSGDSTVVTNASSTGGLIGPSSTSVKHCIASSKRPYVVECHHCRQFHQNHHRPPVPATLPFPPPPPPPAHLRQGSTPYAPYPPQWYFLLAADTKKFRKHRHSHYRRDCRQCREIVRSTFEKYYLGAATPPMPMTSGGGRSASQNGSDSTGGGDSVASVSLDHHPSAELRPRSYSLSGYHQSSPSSFLTAKSSANSTPFYRSRASCGHSCLKFTILFYCCIAVIMSICFICYLTRMFGLMREEIGPTEMMLPSATNYTGNESTWMMDFPINGSISYNTSMFDIVADSEQPATNLLETIRSDMVGLLIASGFMIIFILGLIGAFLESVLCLRIFGAILSYLFLLTFGSALYIVILLVISNVPLKLILSTISCSAVAVTLHGLLAIAPFAFADLINEERNDELAETTNSTYFKYPSVRFGPPPTLAFPPPPLPPLLPGTKPKRTGRSHFGLGGGGNQNWSQMTGTYGQRGDQARTPTTVVASDESSASLPRATPTQPDNISSEGLLPTMEDRNHHSNHHHHHPSQQVVRSNGTGHVRFTDGWM